MPPLGFWGWARALWRALVFGVPTPATASQVRVRELEAQLGALRAERDAAQALAEGAMQENRALRDLISNHVRRELGALRLN